LANFRITVFFSDPLFLDLIFRFTVIRSETHLISLLIMLFLTGQPLINLIQKPKVPSF